DLRELIVEGLADQRRGAPQARQLYRETADSIARREAEAAARKAAGGMVERPQHRPTKKQRRQIHRFRDLMDD
ncbi:MAG: RNA-binding protein, partial [Parahaliea sp.]